MRNDYISAYSVANHILQLSFRDKLLINPMKLQRMVYYVCVMYLQRVGRPLLTERFQVWRYGPVLCSLEWKLRPYGTDPVTKYICDARKHVEVATSSYVNACCAYIWEVCKSTPTICLAEQAYGDGSGWNVAFQRGDTMITEEDMRNDTTVP